MRVWRLKEIEQEGRKRVREHTEGNGSRENRKEGTHGGEWL